MEKRKILIEWDADEFKGFDWKKFIECFDTRCTKFFKMEINYGNKTRKD